MKELLEGLTCLFKKKRYTEDAYDQMIPKGRPTLTVRDRDGNIVSTHTASNLVVRKGRSMLVKALTGEAVSKKVTHMILGKGGVGADPWVPIPPSIEDPQLTTPIPATKKALTGWVYTDANPEPMGAIFSVIYDSTEVNDIVSEVALLLEDNRTYARFTFPSIYLKNDKGYSLEINWTVQFN